MSDRTGAEPNDDLADRPLTRDEVNTWLTETLGHRYGPIELQPEETSDS